MNFEMLNEFLAVARTGENGSGSFIQAAEVLNVAPSTLSKHIRLLEAELGAPLFDRTTRRVSLNDFGRLFLSHAQKMFDSYVECCTSIDQYILPRLPTLRFGSVVPVAADNQCMQAMRACGEKYPGCTFQLTEFGNWKLKKLLRDGALECIIAYDEKNSEAEFTAHPIGSDHLVAIAAKTHAFGALDHISLDMLKDENIAAGPGTSYIGVLVRNACRAAGFSPRIWYSDYSNSNIAHIVDHGGGIGLMMSSSAQYLIGPHTKILSLEPDMSLQLCTFSLREHRLSPVASTFLTELWRLDNTGGNNA